MDKMTAVHYIFYKMNHMQDEISFLNWLASAKDELLAIEKQQIIDAVVWFDDTDRRPADIEKEVESYYNSKYKTL